MKIDTKNTGLRGETVAITKIVKNGSTDKGQCYTVAHVLAINPTISPRLRTVVGFGFDAELLTRNVVGDLLQITTKPSNDERPAVISFARETSRPSRAVIKR